MAAARRDVVVLTNPTAGRGRGRRARDIALPLLRGAGWRVRSVTGRDAEEAADLTRAELDRGADALVLCGGDGLVNLGLRLVSGRELPIGLLPAGTGNDVARGLGLPRRDTVAAARRLLTARPHPIDLARVGERPFATVLAAGFDAVVNERANRMRRPRGQMRYNLATLAELGTYRARDYVLELDGRTVRTAATLVAVGNGPSFGGGLRIAEGARWDDGLLDVIVIQPLTRRQLVATYPRLFTGTHVHHWAFERHRVRRVSVAAPGIVGYADGERYGPLPLTVEAVPAGVEVLA